jgi:hypothetical protein
MKRCYVIGGAHHGPVEASDAERARTRRAQHREVMMSGIMSLSACVCFSNADLPSQPWQTRLATDQGVPEVLIECTRALYNL